LPVTHSHFGGGEYNESNGERSIASEQPPTTLLKQAIKLLALGFVGWVFACIGFGFTGYLQRVGDGATHGIAWELGSYIAFLGVVALLVIFFVFALPHI
jgi:hypothetical protein